MDEPRIVQLEAEVARLRAAEARRERLRTVDLVTEKVREKEPDLIEAKKTVSLSSACTSVCFSSVSSISVDTNALATHDPELAEVFGTLNQKAVEVLGDEGTVDALIERAKEGPRIDI